MIKLLKSSVRCGLVMFVRLASRITRKLSEAKKLGSAVKADFSPREQGAVFAACPPKLRRRREKTEPRFRESCWLEVLSKFFRSRQFSLLGKQTKFIPILFFLLSALFLSQSHLTIKQVFADISTTSTSTLETAALNLSTSTTESARDALAAQVQAKAKELDSLNEQINAVNAVLKQTKSEKNNLQKQISNYNYQISELNLNIKAGLLTIQKLNLEIQSLDYDVQDIEKSIALKKEAIVNIFKKIQQSDSSNLLTVFLKNATLADSVMELQTLKDLESNLDVNISNLSSLEDTLNQKMDETRGKQNMVNLENQNLTYRKDILDDQISEKQKFLATTKNKESVYVQMMSQLEKKQREIADEIETLDAELRTKIDPRLLPAPHPGVLLWPLQGQVTQGYGKTSFAETGYRTQWHNGIDIGASVGTPIVAAEDGTVAALGNQDAYCYKGAYGKFIVINHNDNLSTLYAHLSWQVVKKGDIVKRGQLIGYTGATGYTTGPHLHLTVFAQPTFYIGPSRTCGPMPYGGDLNPLSYL